MGNIDRKELGQEKVGLPLMEAVMSVFKSVEKNNIEAFNKPVADYYIERVFYGRLLSLIDASQDDAALENLDENEVRFITLVLLRDHFRHNEDVLSKMEGSNWIDDVFNSVFDDFSILSSKHEKFKEPFELENQESAKWADELSLPFGLVSFKLFILHSSIVTGVKEDLLKKRKPWWKFW